LRTDKPLVVGLDGKRYRQRKSRKASAAETTTAPSVVNNGTTVDETSSRPFDKMRAALGISNADDRQRVHTYLDIVKDIVAEGFNDETFQLEFLVSLETEFFKK